MTTELVKSQQDGWPRTDLYVVGPDAELTHERVLGEYEYVPFKPDQLITLSQIRGERNVVTNELKEDILFQGLLNPIDVSLVTRELLEQYIDFTNRTWGSNATIDDYLQLALPDERFPLLKSGHSRHEAITELVAEGRLPADQQVMTRISSAESVQDIIDWQRGENIHSQPPRERNAMALVESYMHGIESGQWATPLEFIAVQKAKGRDASKGALDQALKYAQLPPRIRNFILAGQVPYLAGVEMGATTDVLAEFIARSNGYSGLDDARLDDEGRTRLHDIVVMKLDILCNRITEDRLNSTASQKFIQGNRNEWLRLVKSMRSGRRLKQESLGFEFGQDQLEMAYRETQRALGAELGKLRQKYSGADILHFLRLQKGIIPDEEVDRLLAAYQDAVRENHSRISVSLGLHGTFATEEGLDLQDQLI